MKSLREELEGSQTTYKQSEVISSEDGIVNLAFEKDPSDGVDKMPGSKKVVLPENKGLFQQYGGIALTLFASITISFGSLLVKILHQDYSLAPEASGFWRYIGMVIISLPMLMYHQCCAPKDSMKYGSVYHGVLPLTENWRSAMALLVRNFASINFSIQMRSIYTALSVNDSRSEGYLEPRG